MNKADEIPRPGAGTAGYARRTLTSSSCSLRWIVTPSVHLPICFRPTNRKRRFLYRHGGSAATASHFANDISVGTRTGDVKPFRAINLTDNVAVMTHSRLTKATKMFVDQLKSTCAERSLVAISASGNS